MLGLGLRVDPYEVGVAVQGSALVTVWMKNACFPTRPPLRRRQRPCPATCRSDAPLRRSFQPIRIAAEPHVTDPSWFDHHPVVLHVSLRDLAPEILLTATNIVDDVAHCQKANTSTRLAEQNMGRPASSNARAERGQRRQRSVARRVRGRSTGIRPMRLRTPVPRRAVTVSSRPPPDISAPSRPPRPHLWGKSLHPRP